MFACLRGMEQDGDTDLNMTLDTDEQDETISDKSQSLLQKKRKWNISGGDSHYKSDLELHGEPTELVDNDSLPMEKKLNIILSKVYLNNRRFSRLEQIFETVSKHERRRSTIEPVVCSHEDRVRLLEYKSRSDRNNILFYSLKEN